MWDPEEVEIEAPEEIEEGPEFARPVGEEMVEDTTMGDAINAYKKIFESKELTEDERAELDKKIKQMGNSSYISWISHIHSKREQKSYDNR